MKVSTEVKRPSEPWRRGAEDVTADLDTNTVAGLTSIEAAERLKRYGPNSLDAPPPTPGWRKLLGQFRDPLVYLLLVAASVSLIAWYVEGHRGTPYEAIAIFAIISLNAMLGFVQEARSEQAVAALQRIAGSTTGVVRDGSSRRVPSADVVLGDLLDLVEGDIVSADARLTELASLTVAEASLTGESEPTAKTLVALDAGVGVADRTNMVFHGTSVSRGRGRAVVTATGMETEMGAIARMLGGNEEQRTPLQREIDRVGQTLGIAVIVIALVVMGAVLLTNKIDKASDFVDVLLLGVSLAVAAVPEGLPAILSLTLSLGVRRMADERAIVKRLSSVETLGSASVVCTDKTGTLTKNEMTIERVVTASGEVDVTGSGYRPVGELHVAGRPLDDRILLDEVRLVLLGGSLANNAALIDEGSTWTISGDPTEAAFLVAEAKIEGAELREDRFRRVGEIAFSSERKLMTVFAADSEREGRIAIVTKGAPDVLVGLCTHQRKAGAIEPFSEARRAAVLASVDQLADLALRTLAVAYRETTGPTPPSPDDSERDLIYLGLVGIIDPPREEVRQAIAQAKGAGIRVMMITGDHPATAARIAGDLGITAQGADVMSGAEIAALDDDALTEKLRNFSVFARVAPEHKLRIVKALQADNNIVAMTGDGVNDAPALKAADIGVAMGITGSDVAKEAADMILADDNFATIMVAVREGRVIFTNIRKFLRYLLSSNIGEVFTMFFGVAFAGALGLGATGESIAVPLLATQILWINLLTDTAPAIALGFDPATDDVMRRPARAITDRVIDRRMWLGILWVGLVMASVTLVALDLHLAGGLLGGSGTIVEARTMAFTTLVFTQLFNVFNARSDRVTAFHRLFTNRLLWGAVTLSVALQVMVVQLPFLNSAFGTTPMTAADWLLCICLASVVLWADEAKKLIGRSRH